MNEQPKLGQLCDNKAARDAIHIAVAPIEAAFRLSPGQRVGIVGGKAVISIPHVGIVDPFLDDDVQPGDRFYLCLMPGTVTNLRHVYSHPALGGEGLPVPTDVQESENWLRVYALQIKPYQSDNPEKAYQELLAELSQNEIVGYGKTIYCFSDVPDSEELREHAERVLGKRLDFGNFSFHCSC